MGVGKHISLLFECSQLLFHSLALSLGQLVLKDGLSLRLLGRNTESLLCLKILCVYMYGSVCVHVHVCALVLCHCCTSVTYLESPIPVSGINHGDSLGIDHTDISTL